MNLNVSLKKELNILSEYDKTIFSRIRDISALRDDVINVLCNNIPAQQIHIYASEPTVMRAAYVVREIINCNPHVEGYNYVGFTGTGKLHGIITRGDKKVYRYEAAKINKLVHILNSVLKTDIVLQDIWS